MGILYYTNDEFTNGFEVRPDGNFEIFMYKSLVQKEIDPKIAHNLAKFLIGELNNQKDPFNFLNETKKLERYTLDKYVSVEMTILRKEDENLFINSAGPHKIYHKKNETGSVEELTLGNERLSKENNQHFKSKNIQVDLGDLFCVSSGIDDEILKKIIENIEDKRQIMYELARIKEKYSFLIYQVS